MMIADLVDQDDFRDLLKGVGVPVENDWTPEQCSQAALTWQEAQGQQVNAELYRVMQELNQQQPLLLPEVKNALDMLIEIYPL
ncbi:MAG: hypothetical protein V7731_24315 [Amphritea sp.]